MFYNPPNISKNVFLWFVQIKFQRCHAALGKQVYIYICVYMYVYVHLYLFTIRLCWVSAAARRTQFPAQGWNLGPLRWQCGVSAAGPPGKPLVAEAFCFFYSERALPWFFLPHVFVDDIALSVLQNFLRYGLVDCVRVVVFNRLLLQPQDSL